MHSEQSTSTPIAHAAEHPPFELKKHLSDSWTLMTDKLLGIILISLLSFVVFVILTVVAGIAGFFITVNNPEFLEMMKNSPPIIPSIDKAVVQFGALFQQLGLLLAGFILVISYSSSALGAAMIVCVGSVKKIGLGEALGKGFVKAIPMIGLAFFVSLMIMGGYVFFILPGLAIMLLTMFSGYALVLGDYSIFNALKRSVQLVSSHFALVLGRFLLYLIPSFLISGISQAMYEDPELVVAGFLLSMIGSWLLTFFGLPYFILLFRYLESNTPKGKSAHMLWMYIVSGIGLAILGIGIYYGITKGLPLLQETIAEEQAKEQAIPESDIEFSDYVDSSCGVSIPLPNTFETSTGRRWIYEERWVASSAMRGFVPTKQVDQNGVLLAMTNFKTNEQRNPETLQKGESYFYGYPGLIVTCTANTEELTLSEFVEQAQKSKEGTVTLDKTSTFGEFDVQGIWIAGVGSNGNYYKEPFYLAVTPDGANLISIKVWNGDTDQVSAEVAAMGNALRYFDTAEALKDPSIKTQSSKPAKAACQQLKIYEGEFASDKCYSAQDYKDLQYYLQAYNRAISSYNGSVARINIVCNGSEFFKDNCTEAQAEKSTSEGQISQYKGTIQSIMSRGK